MKTIAFFTAATMLLTFNLPTVLSANAADVGYTIDSTAVEENTETTGVVIAATTTTYKSTTAVQPTTTTGFTTTVVTDKQLTEEQQASLDDLTRKGNFLTGEFQRAIAVVLGEISVDSARLTLDEINEVLEQCSSFNEIYEKLKLAYAYPDFIGGSGVGRIEYWLDELGTKKIILFIEPEEVIYVESDENGNVSERKSLWSVENETTPDAVTTVTTTTYKSTKVVQPTTTPSVNASNITEKGTVKLTLDDVIQLSKKGNDLTWEDFSQYISTDIGSGLYVEKYELEDSYTLLVGGVPPAKPSYIRLYRYVDSERTSIDIRTDDIETFLSNTATMISTETTTLTTTTTTAIIANTSTTESTTTYKPTTAVQPTTTTGFTTTVVTDKQLTEEQQASLDDLARKEKRLTGEFQRAKAVVLGEISADSARLTFDEINEVLEQCNSFNEIYEKLKLAYAYPDFIGGSGIGRIEYWLDELGTKKIILFIEPEEVIYVESGENGNVSERKSLWLVEKEMDIPETILAATYRAYNDIDSVETETTITTTTTESENETLPQTGITSMRNWIIFIGGLISIAFGAFAVYGSGIIKLKKNEE